MKRLLALLALALIMAQPARAAIDHQAWDALLKKHVVNVRGGQASLVDYAGMKRDAPQLVRYLETLAGVSGAEFDRWDKPAQLAFLINAYNATTVHLIVGAYPDLTSIKDLGTSFRSPWKKPVIRLLDQVRSLDDIEHGLIRGSGRYQDPRIHFAVNCASIGCPALRPEAYVASRLDAQLDLAARQFLSDRTRNRHAGGMLMVSGIFKWYRADFEAGWHGARRLGDFLALYGAELELDAGALARLANGDLKIGHLDYDWRLNALPGREP